VPVTEIADSVSLDDILDLAIEKVGFTR